MITGKLYDYLKWLAQVVFPGVGTLYVALAGLWGLPSALEVSGTILAVDTFLGLLLGISQINYAKATGAGSIIVTDTGGKMMYNLQLEDDPETLKDMEEVRFKVVKPG